jgi:dihydrofolate reductase
MGKLVVSEFVTLDGVMEAPDKWIGGIHFKLFDEEGGKFKYDEAFAADALLLGRVTYEAFAQAWPPRTGEFADRFNSMPKYVVSNTLDRAEWNATVIKGHDLAEEVGRLKEQLAGDLLVHGSNQLVEALRKLDLVDEYRLWIDPIVVGSGRRLFEAGGEAVLKLTDVKKFPSGTVVLIYHPARNGP